MQSAAVHSHFNDDEVPLKRLLIGTAVALAWPALAWGQAAEISHAVTGATDQLLNQGLVGGLAAFAVAIAALLGWMLYNSMNARLADRDAGNKQFSELAERAIVGLEASKGAIENSVRAIEEQGRANETRRGTMEALTSSHTSLEKAIERTLSTLSSRQGGHS